MTSEDINRTIHSEILGKCWHEYAGPEIRDGVEWYKCRKCPGYLPDDPDVPDYCTDLNAVREAELKVIEMGGWAGHERQLLLTYTRRFGRAGDKGGYYSTASAEVRAEAVLTRWKEIWEKVDSV